MERSISVVHEDNRTWSMVIDTDCHQLQNHLVFSSRPLKWHILDIRHTFSKHPVSKSSQKLLRGSSTNRRPLLRENFPEFVSTGFPIFQSGILQQRWSHTRTKRWQSATWPTQTKCILMEQYFRFPLVCDLCLDCLTACTRKRENIHHVLLPSNHVSFGQIRLELETCSSKSSVRMFLGFQHRDWHGSFCHSATRRVSIFSVLRQTEFIRINFRSTFFLPVRLNVPI